MSAKSLVVAALFALNLGQVSWCRDTRSAAVVSGTVIYRQRSALPPNASINVQLQDVSVQDTKAKLIAQIQIRSEGKQVPIPFRLPYKRARIDTSHSYAVRATITLGSEMIFTSTSSYPVITRGAPTVVSILVEPVRSASPSPISHSDAAKLDEWLGQWNGPEGTYLVLSKARGEVTGDKYDIKIRSLDGLQSFEGAPAGDRIVFTRAGKSESIHAGSGTETGMKWLLEKKDCLIIHTGEGFCRD